MRVSRRPNFSARGAGLALALVATGGALAQPATDDDSQRVLTVDHYLAHESSVPTIKGQLVELYLRERVRPSTVLRGADLSGQVVLFVHGAGTPAEVAFDVPYGDYSWMAYLARAGFDVFAVDMTGYGRSTRPPVMNDPCNLTADAQRSLGIGIARALCSPSHVGATTTIASDWDDIDAAVDYIREIRGVTRVHLVGWSLGGPRAGGYAAAHPDKVGRLVLLAPAYSRDGPSAPSDELDTRAAMSSQSYADFLNYWNGPAECVNQREAVVGDTIFSEMLESDPVGATWGPGIRRAPTTAVWGYNRAAVANAKTPMLAITGSGDASVAPERVHELYADYGAAEKVLIDLGCATHGAMWEANHGLLFEASREWLASGSVNGETSGVVRMGYPD